MALPIYIQDPSTGRRMAVSEDGLLLVSNVQGSSVDVPNSVLTRQKILRAFLISSSGSSSMNINSATSITEFSLDASVNRTMWVTGLRVLFNGVNMEMNSQDFRRFGSATAVNTPLTNGVKLIVRQGGVDTNLFTEPVVRMGQFFDYADNYLNIVNAISAQSDFLYFDFNFTVPVVLPPGSVDRILMTINDNLSSLEQFRAIVRGYQEFI